MNLYKTDCHAIWSQLKRDDKELVLKRRWLMGLYTSKSDKEQSRLPKCFKKKSLPESLLREDDIFYETIKRSVEEAYGECDVEGGQHMNQDHQVVDLPNISEAVMSRLDDMSNKGLYHVAMILTGGSVRFENTRWTMKNFIRESLSKISENQNQNNDYIKISRQVSQLLSNPHYFRQKSATYAWASHSQNAAVKIIDGLEDLPIQTLKAMHRKIRGIQGGIPRFNLRRSGWKRALLINQLRKSCKEMLSKLGEGDELQEPLSKAMAVAGLSRKLSTGFQNSNVTEFCRFTPEIVILQNEIAKAIWMIKNKVRYPELKNLHLLLDPDAKVSSMHLRSTIKKLLTEYLFDCNDMDTIPKSLSEAIAIINRSSRTLPYKCFPKEEVEEEVECILNVSAQTKQIVLDLLPNHDYDQDFTSAYMEDLEESDDGDSDDDIQQLLHNYSQSKMFECNDSQLECIGESSTQNIGLNQHQVESMGESGEFRAPGNGISPLHSASGRLSGNSVSGEEPVHDTMMDSANSPDPFSSNLSCGQENSVPNKQSTSKNHYLAIQDLCDDTSLISYHLIGHMLKEYVRIDGLNLDLNDEIYLRGNRSVPEDSQDAEEKLTSSMEDVDGSFIVRVVEELMPSFSQSGKERLKKLTSLL